MAVEASAAEGALPIPAWAPRVGSRVHYVSHGSPLDAEGAQRYPSACRAAIVTEIPGMMFDPLTLLPEHRELLPDQPVSLVVFSPAGLHFDDCERDEEGRAGGTWHARTGCDS